MLKVATNGKLTLHLILCSRVAFENYNNNDQAFNRHEFRGHARV